MIKHIPNAITCCNLLSGCISIVLMCNGYAVAAGVMIFMAAIFDFFDGFAARLLKAYSPLGAQLDSLSDVVSFGVAPSFIMYHYLSQVVETSPLCHSWLSSSQFSLNYALLNSTSTTDKRLHSSDFQLQRWVFSWHHCH